jgi:hypothetical protein
MDRRTACRPDLSHHGNLLSWNEAAKLLNGAVLKSLWHDAEGSGGKVFPVGLAPTFVRFLSVVLL